MEPNYLDMSIDSLEASMARDILEASIREATAEPASPPKTDSETSSTPKTDSETPKGTDNNNDEADNQSSKPLDQSLNLMDLSMGPALTAGSSVESPNLAPDTNSLQHDMDLEVTDAGVGSSGENVTPLDLLKEAVDTKPFLSAVATTPSFEREIEEQEELNDTAQTASTCVEDETKSSGEGIEIPDLEVSRLDNDNSTNPESKPVVQEQEKLEVREQQQELSVASNEQAASSLGANDDAIDDIQEESGTAVVVATEDAVPSAEISSSIAASDQSTQGRAEVKEEVKENTRGQKASEEVKVTEEEKVKEEEEEFKDQDDEESCESDRVILDDDCSEEDEELSSDQTQQQPSFRTAAGGHSVAADPSIFDQSTTTSYMEFTKNYSDDLLMGGSSQVSGGEGGQQPHDMMPNADLADFELPPYSGSSSGSENQQQPQLQQQSSSQRKSSQAQASSAATTSSSSHTSAQASAPSLTAVMELLMATYSRGAHLLQWKRPIETGIIFGIGANFIMALTFFSIISVIAYSALGLILASASIRLYKTFMKTLNKSTDTPLDHIWNKMLALNVSISSDKLYELVDASHGNLNASLAYFKQVLLIEDKIATIKFGIFLYILTYIGAWFNGMTLITIGYLALFSVPILYQQNKAKIDEILNLLTGQLSSTIGMVTSRVSTLAFGGSASDSKKKN